MKPFIHEDFLLQNKTAVRLYHDYVEGLPIIDYHCHINPKEIADNRKFNNITELWLGSDHYKWRAMRVLGIEETYITGQADGKEKFLKWAETLPNCLGNPLYHWTHLELKRYFGIDQLLSGENAGEIWEKCNARLNADDMSARELVKRSNVEVICTTDDPADSLEYHQAIAKDSTFAVKVFPAMTVNRCYQINQAGFLDWLSQLDKISGIPINSLDSYKQALLDRIQHFDEMGCKLSDVGLETPGFDETADEEAAGIFLKVLEGKDVTAEETTQFTSNMILFLGKAFANRHWVMQLRIGAMRNNNDRMFGRVGPDTGFDAISDENYVKGLAKFLNALEKGGQLPKTIIYCLNPRDNEAVVALTGCFPGSGTAGKVQFGSAWWFNDHKDGMEKQMTVLANQALLGSFIGMTTDSRSFTAYTRHEYFRRILCNLLGKWVESGEVPQDMDLLGNMARNICYFNARKFFGF